MIRDERYLIVSAPITHLVWWSGKGKRLFRPANAAHALRHARRPPGPLSQFQYVHVARRAAHSAAGRASGVTDSPCHGSARPAARGPPACQPQPGQASDSDSIGATARAACFPPTTAAACLGRMPSTVPVGNVLCSVLRRVWKPQRALHGRGRARVYGALQIWFGACACCLRENKSREQSYNDTNGQIYIPSPTYNDHCAKITHKKKNSLST